MPQPKQDTARTRFRLQAMTDVGLVRTHNEDNFIVCPNLADRRWYLSDTPQRLQPQGCLLVVADGMGGTNAGEVASALAIESIQKHFDALPLTDRPDEERATELMRQAIAAAHQTIVQEARQNAEQAGMGTTLIMAWVFAQKALIGWVGDSRAYLYQPASGLRLLTSDHSLVWEMVKAGTLTPEEADVHPRSNIITQSLGNGAQAPAPDFISCPLAPGDRLLLCTDGLNNMVPHTGIEKILQQGAIWELPASS
ncbi:protein phosphatase 2C domain-containing protein [Cesiribacter andamanensis]|uniref:Serine/threonine phosphatase stp n=1 Tax=Cesiribacter andamanensis AMV16 TaxID=1279009 RepID=M7NR03_9BACT|nr:protein phosphatase 2C domain-containing protein [Cesiribacter andamanensis]EMR00934.1 Serine/threonine phosphatase stp [Cesiribacter andamanensis AMV16]